MGRMQRSKGARGEREWRDELRRMGFTDAIRGRQYSGHPDAPDVAHGIPGTHPEVKRTESLSLYKAMEQAAGDAGNSIPYVAHRRNRREWLVVIRADDLLQFARHVLNGAGE